jgi:hypothetical protein
MDRRRPRTSAAVAVSDVGLAEPGAPRRGPDYRGAPFDAIVMRSDAYALIVNPASFDLGQFRDASIVFMLLS